MSKQLSQQEMLRYLLTQKAAALNLDWKLKGLCWMNIGKLTRLEIEK